MKSVRSLMGGALAIAVLAAGCGDDQPFQVLPGTVEVTISTTGDDIDADGYVISTDFGPDVTVAANAMETLTDVPPGTYDFTVMDIADNCTLAGANPRTVQVTSGQTTTVTLNITCDALTGDALVTTTTTGTSIDNDGYSLTVDGAGAQTIGVNDSVFVADLATGDHDFELAGVAANCMVDTNPQTGTVVAGDTVTVAFTITCAATMGSVRVNTNTTGSNLDPDGYTISVDGGAAVPIAINSNITIGGLSTGAHTVVIAGVAANCTVTGGNSQNVNVTAGATANVTFNITCTGGATTGDLTVTTSTSGSNLDPDGYSFTIDGGSATAIGINDSQTVNNVASGTRTVVLSGVAANCTVTGGNTQNVNVPAGGSVTAAFTITCSATTGDLTVTTSTSGSNLDPDGYSFTIDGGSATAIGINDSQTVNGVASGTRTVVLSGVAANCTVTGGNTQNVNVPAGGSVTAAFTITCAATSSSQIAFQSNRTGTIQIWLMDENGSNPVQVTSTIGSSTQPSFAPSGNQVAYRNNNDIWVINTDGTGATNLTSSLDDELEPAWSPSGTRLAFMRQLAAGGEDDIWIMNADGTNQIQLTTDAARDAEPTWNPGETQIAFSSARTGTDQIWIMNSDGTSPMQLTTAGGDFPDWSPDGTKIAFNNAGDIYTINPDGTGLTQLTTTGNNFFPSWSDDSSQIAFTSSRSGNNEIWTMNADGTNQVNITNNAAADALPDWEP